jgi:hypothetical protein
VQASNCTAEPGLICGPDGECQCAQPNPDRCGNSCTNLRSDANNCSACGADCGGGACLNGLCDCPGDLILGILGCGLPDGFDCTSDDECADGPCQTYFLDEDGDSFGENATSIRLCGFEPGFPPVAVGSWTAQGGDCCDIAFSEAARAISPNTPPASAADVPEQCVAACL